MFVFLGAAGASWLFAPQKPNGQKHGISNSLEIVCQGGKIELKQAGVCSAVWRPQRERERERTCPVIL